MAEEKKNSRVSKTGKYQSVTHLVRRLLGKGKSVKTILAILKKEYPKSKATAKDVYWHRHAMKKTKKVEAKKTVAKKTKK